LRNNFHPKLVTEGMEIKGKTFLVCGASGVLGSEIVGLLREQGAKILATASSNESAGKIPTGVEVRLLLDYTKPESIQTLTDYLTASSEIDGIVNASGVVAFGEAGELSQSVISQLFAINAAGPIQLFSALAKLLAKKEESVIVNLTGVVAETPLPGIAAYSASKFAVEGFLQAAAREWRRSGTRVISARPGHTETGLAERAIAGTAPKFPQGKTPLEVAQRIIRAISEDEKELPSTAF
jgi:NAD(P)-dependent dehydrogenase (short-subunit alcohol dehydrogenase family)